ncbi:bifunctional tRNA (5-methylaminomethyl-2-thiouridine)(34)-methyltransferase MnmD/FAD-dependent 5-carboxymethylaminomethyl-2-thiouridine(34) oxidoreductase MnmC [Chitinibacter fontanus]|uniref:tRNA 5-methylaminomethyl-2-thiouridine biosynthesis bifunctional protein MnmC n=1 Tax=Chitinibacter fontanus TaxID=1737446 RepID=A0A7D5VCC6_9NEIS|nr:bifunctional tRNA (5-methylaminomethyl-2-thiouridine)(34)-methyltransferase MnmD/FAD-dependent 5-carboxymethylaminomethyl-2-thiouridine(34) oxidoreductase MnmC [Chitinibacter fontanus]QLI82972.1 bifunctional tRNA (5-methylaminomethyl-2-thiouridine)(34)-methyltransferase MnmD/FAD-dependent 5-carboxymethylaminomethyl-2-thiouridine(34) oxidoreductase MnmC [Chitinibacter fontanus]
MAITPAVLEFASDGLTPFSSQYNDIYHSAHGAKAQVEAVFLAGNQLPARWQNKSCFSILETGFGQGLSFLTTWQAWRDDPLRSERLHFLSVEQHPFSRADMQQLHQQYPEFAELSEQLLQHWPHLTLGFHRIWLDQGRVSLTLLFGDALAMLHEVVAKVDAIFLDGFAPSKNPDMWRAPVFKALWRLCQIDTTLATYTVAGSVRRGLIEAGFTVQKVEGFASKRQMLIGQCARLPKPPRLIRPEPVQLAAVRHAIVVGAGVAGCSTAASLASRGWQVTLCEAEPDVAQLASGNHVGLCHPALSKDDNALARLSRAGFAMTRQKLLALCATGCDVHFGFDGQFQLAKDAEHEALMRETISSLGFPPDLVEFLSPEQASIKIGSRPSRGGWWFPEATWLNPPSLCKAYIAQRQSNIDLKLNTRVDKLSFSDGYWHALSDEGYLIAQAPVLIVANATAAVDLLPALDLPLSQSWRAVTQIPSSTIPANVGSCSGGSYLTAEWNGWRSVGAAPYDANMTEQACKANLNALTSILPDLPVVSAKGTNTRICARPNSLDRLPLIGAVHEPLTDPAERGAIHQLYQMPRQAGLYAILGLGSRGMTWHALAAEIIACSINNEPLPIERTLLNALDPARFELRQLRKGLN